MLHKSISGYPYIVILITTLNLCPQRKIDQQHHMLIITLVLYADTAHNNLTEWIFGDNNIFYRERPLYKRK